MRYFLSSGRRRKSLSFDESDKLGRGASATVYRVTVGSKIFAAKIYHNDKVINLAKINVMLNEVPKECLIVKDGIEYPQLAWPTDIIYDDVGNPSGILLPLIDTAESFTLDHYYDKALFKKLGSPDEAALSYKLEIARNLAHVVATLHELGHYIIDCKPQNIRVFKRSHIVTLIDCDGFSINAKGVRYPAEMLSTDYIAPEAQRRSASPSTLVESQDRYALAVILFQLLNQGTHPFQGIITDPTVSFNTNDEKAAAGLYPHGQVPNDKIKPRRESIHHLWDIRTRGMFDSAFTTGSPTARPSAKQWADHFEELLVNKALQRCQRVPNNLEHIRFRDMSCPACYLAGLPKITPKVTKRSVPNPINSVSITTIQKSKPISSNSSKTLLWAIIVIGVIIIIIASQSSISPSETPNTTQSTSLPSSTYAPDNYENRYIWNTAYSDYKNFGIYQDRVERILAIPDSATRTSYGGVARIKSIEMVNVGWEIIKSKNTAYYPFAYWINYQALKLGHPEGASNMAMMHELGLGTEINYSSAVYWYNTTIKMGQPHSAQAEVRLAKIYRTGLFGPVDLVTAKDLYILASKIINDNKSSASTSNELLEEIRDGLLAIKSIEDNKASSKNNIVRPEIDSTPLSSDDNVGFISVFASDRLGAGWAAGYRSQAEADAGAKEICQQYVTDGTCKSLLQGNSRCVNVAVGTSGLGSAGGANVKEASDRALSKCREIDGNSNCVAAKAVCQSN